MEVARLLTAVTLAGETVLEILKFALLSIHVGSAVEQHKCHKCSRPLVSRTPTAC